MFSSLRKRLEVRHRMLTSHSPGEHPQAIGKHHEITRPQRAVG
jgi:hypothetical protein